MFAWLWRRKEARVDEKFLAMADGLIPQGVASFPVGFWRPDVGKVLGLPKETLRLTIDKDPHIRVRFFPTFRYSKLPHGRPPDWVIDNRTFGSRDEVVRVLADALQVIDKEQASEVAAAALQPVMERG